ncbi:MAG: WHG domain-containing protein, partial [Anaerolineae bacterium]|nr:WHG domain-containing protein [Anaerolineae bacterium]
LYRYVDSKTELLRAVNLMTTQGLVSTIREATSLVSDPKTRLIVMAKAYRSFAHTYPVTYMLAFMNPVPEHRLDEALAERMVLPLQDIVAELTGREESLRALRGFWSLVHGFVILELGGQFRRGGDLSAAYLQAVEAYLAGWSRQNGTG